MELASVNALFYPFEQGEISWPDENQKVYYLNARYSKHLSNLNGCELYLQQFNYTCSQELKIKGFQSYPEYNSEAFDLAFINIPKDMISAQIYIAEALNKLKAGGVLVCAARNDAGGKRISKTMADMGCVSNKISKFKSTICVVVKNQDINEKKIASILQQNKLSKNDFGYWSMPGVYGRDKIDIGSQMLLEHIDELKGGGADLGCGYGYLSIIALKKFKSIDKLYMVDNDYRSIVSSKKNIRELADHKDVSFMWNDVNELNFEDAKLDWVIMNPPFHQFKDTNPVVGTSFISSSEKLLKKGGFLWMVSNAHLAYEDHIFSLFSSADKVIEKNGFKVYCARK